MILGSPLHLLKWITSADTANSVMTPISTCFSGVNSKRNISHLYRHSIQTCLTNPDPVVQLCSTHCLIDQLVYKSKVLPWNKVLRNGYELPCCCCIFIVTCRSILNRLIVVWFVCSTHCECLIDQLFTLDTLHAKKLG